MNSKDRARLKRINKQVRYLFTYKKDKRKHFGYFSLRELIKLLKENRCTEFKITPMNYYEYMEYHNKKLRNIDYDYITK